MARNKYFTVSNGLRGCYMPDSCHTYCFTSRKSFVEFFTEEAENVRSDDVNGVDEDAFKANAAALAKEAWQRWNEGWQYDLVLPIGDGYGLFIGRANLNDFRECQKANDYW